MAVRRLLPIPLSKLRGADGQQGRDGRDGIQGPKGESGLQGLPGAVGPKGDKGDCGPAPAHRWSGESLQFQNPDGSWGKLVNLQGRQGASGKGGGGASFGTVPVGNVSGLYEWLLINYPLGEDMPYTQLVDTVGDIKYIGQADPGSSQSDPVWRIKRITFLADGDIETMWANGASNFDRVWDSRLTETYS